MRGYRISLFVFSLITVIAVCGAIGYGLQHWKAEPVETEEFSIPAETESVSDNRLVINQVSVEPATEAVCKYRYYLVSETGYLLVFDRQENGDGPGQLCLQTHIPIYEFPEEEQEQLRKGIWFETMIDVFAYLESYTS